MRKILILFFFLTFGLLAQTKYFLPFNVQQSNGRPINGANVDLYATGTSTKVYDLTYQDNSPGQYYYTSAFAEAVYDLYVNGNAVMTRISLGGTVSTADVAGLITAFANDSLTASNGVVYSGRDFSYKLISDTATMKAYSASTNTTLYYGGTEIGQGEFVKKASGYTTRLRIAMAATGGGHWVRKEWIENPKVVNYDWIYATKTGSNISSYINTRLQTGETLHLPPGRYTGAISFTWSTTADSLIIQGSGENKTFIQGLTMFTARSIEFRDLAFYTTYGGGTDCVLTGSRDSTTFKFTNVRCLGNGGPHVIQVAGDSADYYFSNVKITSHGGAASHGLAVRGANRIFVNFLQVDSCSNGITIKSADSDVPIVASNIANYAYRGAGNAIFLESNDSKPVENVNFVNVTVDSGANHVLSSNTYDAGLGVYNGIIRNVTIANVTAPYIRGTGFIIDGIANLLISNVAIDTCAGSAIQAVNGTGVLSYYLNNFVSERNASGYFAGALPLYGQYGNKLVTYGKLRAGGYFNDGILNTKEGAHLVIVSDTLAEIASYENIAEFRATPSNTNKATQSTREIVQATREVAGVDYYNTSIWHTLGNRTGSYDGSGVKYGLGYIGTGPAFGVRHGTTHNFLSASATFDRLDFGGTPGRAGGPVRWNFIDSTPILLMTDLDLNTVYSTSEAAGADTAAIKLNASAGEIQMTDEAGKTITFRTDTTTTATKGLTAAMPDSVEGFLNIVINGKLRKIPYVKQ